MMTLLAESKTMSPLVKDIEEELLIQHTPVFEEQADFIMNYFEQLSPEKLAEILGINRQLGIKAHNLAYDFPHKAAGYEALFGFTGEAFRGLDASSLSIDEVNFANKSLRFVSSVYGLLKPDDIIKPYRCEFNKPITPENKTAIQIFKQKNTIELVNLIKKEKIKDIIDLLPADADKCFDWKIIRAFASVHKICFKEISADGSLKTPIAKKLKESRGRMARHIIKEKITSFSQLSSEKSDYFIFSPHDSKPGLPLFYV